MENKLEDLPKLYAKLHKVMESVERIGKDKKNTHQGYDYASEKAIKEVLHKQLVKNKILFKMDANLPQIVDGKTMVEVVYNFIDIETGSSIQGNFVGSGQARDEKGVYTAITGAIKYILTTTFLIPTGDDAEADEDTASNYPIKSYQVIPKEKPEAPRNAPSATAPFDFKKMVKNPNEPASEAQINKIKAQLKSLKKTQEAFEGYYGPLAKLTKGKASEAIETMNEKLKSPIKEDVIQLDDEEETGQFQSSDEINTKDLP